MTKEINLDDVKEEEVVGTTEEVEDTNKAQSGGNDDDFTVADPQVLRPKELPLVINPGKGGWANPEQEEYAQTLNGYAYTNPEKWEQKKDVLLQNLRDLEKTPNNINRYRGMGGGVSFTNKSFGPNA